jgi:phage-related tail fiber protein
MSTPPTGYLECNGAAISRTTYAALFTAISDDYGAGNGTTTFNLPDYRGEFLRGWAHGDTTDPDRAARTNRGDGTGGDVVGSKQADGLKAHVHQYHDGGYDPGGSTYIEGSVNQNSPRLYDTVSTGGNETRPTNINVMYCIKY